VTTERQQQKLDLLHNLRCAWQLTDGNAAQAADLLMADVAGRDLSSAHNMKPLAGGCSYEDFRLCFHEVGGWMGAQAIVVRHEASSQSPFSA